MEGLYDNDGNLEELYEEPDKIRNHVDTFFNDTMCTVSEYNALSGAKNKSNIYSSRNDIEMKLPDDVEPRCEEIISELEEKDKPSKKRKCTCQICFPLTLLFIVVMIMVASLSILSFFAYRQFNSLKLQVNSLQNNVSLTEEIMQLNTSKLISIEEEIWELHSLVTASTLEIDTFNKTLNELVLPLNKMALYNTSQYFDTIIRTLGVMEEYPAFSCSSISILNPSFPSGYYWVTAGSNQSKLVYCELSNAVYGVPGWVRIAKLNKTMNGAECFPGLQQSSLNSSSCVAPSESATCSHTFFSTLNISYSKVYGTVRAFGILTPDGFNVVSSNFSDIYVDGISFTYGMPSNRHHLFTLAANGDFRCGVHKPEFVSFDYQCLNVNSSSVSRCSGNSCSQQFFSNVGITINQDIEMRVCRDDNRDNEDIIIEDMELYIQ